MDYRPVFLVVGILLSMLAAGMVVPAIVDAVAARDLDKAASLVPDEAVEAFAVAGTPLECAKSLEAYLEAGLQEPVIQVSGSEEEKSLALQVIRQFTSG